MPDPSCRHGNSHHHPRCPRRLHRRRHHPRRRHPRLRWAVEGLPYSHSDSRRRLYDSRRHSLHPDRELGSHNAGRCSCCRSNRR